MGVDPLRTPYAFENKHRFTSAVKHITRKERTGCRLARGRQSTYVSATAFYPLWAGLATPEEARKIVRAALNNSFAFGGQNACVVVRKYEQGTTS